jgi:hypothetical protein
LCAVLILASCGSDNKATSSATTKTGGTASTKAGSGSAMDGYSPDAAATSAAGTSAPATSVHAAPAGEPEACKLVTQQEAENLAGIKLDPANQVEASCTFTAPTSGPVGQVEVFVGDGAKKFLDIDRELAHEFTPIQGAGDEAYYEEDTVFLRKGSLWITVRLTRLNDPAENRPKLEAMARTVAGRV